MCKEAKEEGRKGGMKGRQVVVYSRGFVMKRGRGGGGGGEDQDKMLFTSVPGMKW